MITLRVYISGLFCPYENTDKINKNMSMRQIYKNIENLSTTMARVYITNNLFRKIYIRKSILSFRIVILAQYKCLFSLSKYD